MDCRITLIPGDGIGPEIVTEAVKVLDAVAAKYGHKFDYTKILMGGCSIDECGVPLTDEAVAVAKASDAVLLGAVGGNVGNSRWYDVAPNLRPEAGLLKIRKDLELFANIRPAYLYNELKAACPLKEEIIGDGFDMVIMRELTGGLYFGKRHTEEVDGLMTAVDTLTYNEEEIRRIATENVVSTNVTTGKKDRKIVSVANSNHKKIFAVGCGKAVVELKDGTTYGVLVRPAKISLLLLIGQSNMEGSHSDDKTNAEYTNNAILNSAGKVYNTYGPSCRSHYKRVANWSKTSPALSVANASKFVPKSLTDNSSDYEWCRTNNLTSASEQKKK